MELKPIAFNGLKSAFGMFRKDLEALPDEAFTRTFAPKARTVADIVHEINLVNDHIGLTLRGEPLFDWPSGWIKAPDELKSKETVLAAFNASAQRILDTVEPYTDSDMELPVVTERGTTNRFERCRFIQLHLWYHSGQLNFIQTLLGDDEWHW